MELHKFGVKLFAEGAAGLDLLELIPVFHGWIQRGQLADLAIDVADYTHVHQGPGLMLIAHEGNYALDEAEGRRGLAYYLKRPVTAGGPPALERVLQRALQAARLLESAPPPSASGLRFPLTELEVFANDRLAVADAMDPALAGPARELADRLFGPDGYRMAAAAGDPRERPALRLHPGTPAALDELLQHLAA